MDVFAEIKTMLDKHRCAYAVSDHAPTPRSIDAARIRGTPIEQGAKAIVLRSEGRFLMCVLPGSQKIDFHKIKTILSSKSVSLATPEEVYKVTQCVTGSVPPFGNLFGIPLYIESSLLRNEEISFNAGLQTRSITMKSEEYRRVANGIVKEFAR